MRSARWRRVSQALGLTLAFAACGPARLSLDLVDLEPAGVPFSPGLTGMSVVNGHLLALNGKALLAWPIAADGTLTPATPFELPGATTDRGGSAMVVRGTRAWCWFNGRVWLLDVSAPAAPTVLRTATWDSSVYSVGAATMLGDDLVATDGLLVNLAQEDAAWATLTGARFYGPDAFVADPSRRLLFSVNGATISSAKAGATAADGWARVATLSPSVTFSTPTLVGAENGKLWVCHEDLSSGTPGLFVFDVAADGTIAPEPKRLSELGCKGRLLDGVAWTFSHVTIEIGRPLAAWDSTTGAVLGELPLTNTTVSPPGPLRLWDPLLATKGHVYVETNLGLAVVSKR